MRYSLLILAVALSAGTTKARADLIAYNMTGTITSANDGYSSFAVGDHISWTLQYNTSMPMYTYATTANNASQLYNPLITSIVDRTTGSHLYVPTTLYVPPYLAGGGGNGGGEPEPVQRFVKFHFSESISI